MEHSGNAIPKTIIIHCSNNIADPEVIWDAAADVAEAIAVVGILAMDVEGAIMAEKILVMEQEEVEKSCYPEFMKNIPEMVKLLPGI